MGLITWGQNPWGLDVPVHIAWSLCGCRCLPGWRSWLFMPSGFVSAPGPRPPSEAIPPETASCIPENVPRHSCRPGYSIGSWPPPCDAALFGLPAQGRPALSWVNIHWAAGFVLTLSIVFHIIHAVFFMDFWSIWPGKADLENGWRGLAAHLWQRWPGPAGNRGNTRWQQAVPSGHRGLRIVYGGHRRAHDVPGAHAFFYAQPLSL